MDGVPIVTGGSAGVLAAAFEWRVKPAASPPPTPATTSATTAAHFFLDFDSAAGSSLEGRRLRAIGVAAEAGATAPAIDC